MQTNKYITDKLVNGVWYERAPKIADKPFCSGCVGAQENIGTCHKLSEKDCASEFIYKAKEDAKVQQEGVKEDTGKPQYSLIPPYALEQVAKCLTEGLKTHPMRDNWKLVPDAKKRYLDSLIRHQEQYRQGQYFDKDSPTVPNLAAVIVNALFLLEFEHNPELKDSE